MGTLPHETMGWDAIYNGSWKNSPSYRGPCHPKERWRAFFGLNLPMKHRFDIRELFVRKEDFAGEFNFPTYRTCWRRLFANE